MEKLNAAASGHFGFGTGPIAVVATNLLLYVVLIWLARDTRDPFDRTLLLALGNVVLACVLLLPSARNGRFLLNRTTSAALAGWSIAYCLICGAFVRWPEFIPV